MATPLEIFGNTVRQLRREKGLSQEDLARLAGLHRIYIGGIERGERNLALMNILQLAWAFDVLPSELFRDFDEQTMLRFFPQRPRPPL